MKQILILITAITLISCESKDFYTIQIENDEVILYDGTKEVYRESLDSGSELSKAILKDNE